MRSGQSEFILFLALAAVLVGFLIWLTVASLFTLLSLVQTACDLPRRLLDYLVGLRCQRKRRRIHRARVARDKDVLAQVRKGF